MSGRFLQLKRSKISTLLPARQHAHSAPAAAAVHGTAATTPGKPYKKGKIPKALREALWMKTCGKSFEVKCHTTWCQNRITAYDFQAGHNVPEARGGPTTLDNLVPICSRCNLSMGSQYTFDEWCRLDRTGAEVATKPVAVPEASSTAPIRATISFWCCSRDCMDYIVEPETPPQQPTVQANPLQPPKGRTPRRVSPATAGPAVIVPPSV